MARDPFLRGALGGAVLAACLAVSAPTIARAAPTSITVRPIASFHTGSHETRFGALAYVGGFSFTASDSALAGLSGLILSRNGTDLLAISDLGHWFSARIVRDDAGVPIGLEDADIRPLHGLEGQPLEDKDHADAEGLARLGDDVLVSFERQPRILAYPGYFPRPGTRPPRVVAQPIPLGELRRNEGLETLAVAPEGTPLDGAAITIAEGSIDTDGHFFAAILDGPKAGIFKLRRDERWNVTDADILPGGDLVVLERRYDGLTGGLGARLRRIPGETIAAGALVDGPVIFEADLAEEIDNMEGLAIWRDAEGRTRLTLISDDNASFFQRNLLLEFILVDEAAGERDLRPAEGAAAGSGR